MAYWRLLALLLVPVAAPATDAVSQSIGHAQVNWSDKTVTATGSGAPSLKAANAAAARLGAERAAKLDAYRNALEAVRGVRLTGKDTAGAAIDSSPDVKAKISGVIQGFKTVDIKYYSDGGVDVIISGPLDGVLTDSLVGAGATAAVTEGFGDGTTGVVIDAKGLGVTPALAPRLVDEDSNAVYTASLVNRDIFHAHGMVEYVKSVDLATKTERAGQKPLVIKAKALVVPGSSDLVLPAAEAEKIRKLGSVVAAGKVVIVVD